MALWPLFSFTFDFDVDLLILADFENDQKVDTWAQTALHVYYFGTLKDGKPQLPERSGAANPSSSTQRTRRYKMPIFISSSARKSAIDILVDFGFLASEACHLGAQIIFRKWAPKNQCESHISATCLSEALRPLGAPSPVNPSVLGGVEQS